MSELFNPFVDFAKARRDYRDDSKVRIDDVFEKAFVEEVIQHIVRNIEFKNAFISQQQVRMLSDAEIQAMPQEEQQKVFTEVHQNASNGFGFLYGSHKVDKDFDRAKHQVITKVYDWLNAESTLESIRDILGDSSIVSANCQVTRYSQGQFLTRHDDVNAKEGRRVAYVISLTPDWHPDWGGLLQFYTKEGEPTNSFSPKFNSMTMFDVKHPHSVTYLAPYIKYYRYSITGWFCDKPQ